MIANSGHDENGRYIGGKAGDQTGSEFEIRKFYVYPWTEVWEPPSRLIGMEVAKLARNAAKNDHIGYDQGNRLSFDNALQKTAHNDPAEIVVDVEEDCSSGVASILRAVGRRLGVEAMASIPNWVTTWSIGAYLRAAGWNRHTASKYLGSDACLGKGWILNNTQHHIAINVSDGSKFSVAAKKPNFRFKLLAAASVRSRRLLNKWFRLGTYKKGTLLRISGVSKTKTYWWGEMANGKGFIKIGTVKGGIKYLLPCTKWLRSSMKKSAFNHIKKLAKGKTVVLSEIKKGEKHWWGRLADGSGWILLS